MLPDDTAESLHERIKEVGAPPLPAGAPRAGRRGAEQPSARGRRRHSDAERARRRAIDVSRRALLSVYDKTGLVEFARGLARRSASSSCPRVARRRRSPTPASRSRTVESVTGVPEMLEHRVVTLHPKVHGGILADRGKSSPTSRSRDARHRAVRPRRLEPLPVPRAARDRDDRHRRTGDDAGRGEEPRVGRRSSPPRTSTAPCSRSCAPTTGRCRTRPGARSRWRRSPAPRRTTRRSSAGSRPTSCCRQHLVLPLDRTDETLRYGENPHQQAARYRLAGTTSWWDGVAQHVGLALSLPQLLRHRRGVAPRARSRRRARPARDHQAREPVRRRDLRRSRAVAYQRALECDERSAFGGIVALNRPVDAATVERMVAGPQADVVIAPGTNPARSRLSSGSARTRACSKHRRPRASASTSARSPAASSCRNRTTSPRGRDDWRVVTKAAPTDEQWRDAELAWRICGHVKSNAIVLVKDGQAVGIGAGQQNRVESGEIAAKKADGRAVGGACASDAFYPFPDGIEAAAASGVAVVVQPGGSMRRRAQHRPGRRARPRDGVHRRTSLPPLMMTTTMTAQLLDGKAFLETTKARLATQVSELAARGVTPGLGTILVGDDPNSHAYVRGKRAACEEIGMTSHHRELAADVSRDAPARGDHRVQREPRRRRVHRAAPAARSARRGGRAARGRPGQGCRRTAPGQPRSARDGRPGAPTVHPARHPGAPVDQRRRRSRASTS